MEKLTGCALSGIENAPKITEGLAIADELFPFKEFVQNLKPIDELDEALQPVFQLLARDFPGHRLIVTAVSATLEESRCVTTYVNIEGARAALLPIPSADKLVALSQEIGNVLSDL